MGLCLLQKQAIPLTTTHVVLYYFPVWCYSRMRVHWTKNGGESASKTSASFKAFGGARPFARFSFSQLVKLPHFCKSFLYILSRLLFYLLAIRRLRRVLARPPAVIKLIHNFGSKQSTMLHVLDFVPKLFGILHPLRNRTKVEPQSQKRTWLHQSNHPFFFPLHEQVNEKVSLGN